MATEAIIGGTTEGETLGARIADAVKRWLRGRTDEEWANESCSGIRRGDTVRVRSGGPVMTVGDCSPVHGTIRCEWFDGNRQCYGMFWAKSVEKVDACEARAA